MSAVRLPGPDLDPIEAARRLRGRRGRFLLHSASDADGCGRWSFAGAEPARVLCARGGDSFAALAALVADAPLPGDAGPVPAAVGWLGYDLGRIVERIPSVAVDDLGLPDLWFGRYRAIWRHDAATGRAEVVGDDEEAARALHGALAKPPAAAARPPVVLGPLEPEHDAERHLRAVERALEYIRAGDIYQVNLARRLRAEVRAPGDALPLYEATARVAPAPYGALVECDGVDVVSNSPELFLRRAAGAERLETRPIKGTRARGVPAAELAADPKELAEHLMIVDLERNDLGRVARIGSVAVEGYARVMTLPTVHHLVSTVSARLRADAALPDILRATFPGGSITGAPKVRAMQIIDELEPVRRGVYTGALGWLGAGGAMELAIVIRTAVVAASALHLHVGGGIVADSRPLRELEETEEKAVAWRTALRASGSSVRSCPGG